MPQLLIPEIIIASTVISTGISIASAAGAFAPDVPDLPPPPEVPGRDDPQVLRDRRAERLRASKLNLRATTLSKGTETTASADVGNATVLG